MNYKTIADRLNFLNTKLFTDCGVVVDIFSENDIELWFCGRDMDDYCCEDDVIADFRRS